MRFLAIIQARCGSSRLPNKVLKDLCGKPVLQRVIERVQKCSYVDEVMVVTSIEKNNLPILALCAQLNIRVGIGSENDVLDRYYQTAKLLKPTYVIRITADCPCFDPQLLEKAIRELSPETDYLGMMSETFADGLDLEIFKYSALERAWKEAKHTFEREHVTQYIVRHPELFVLQDFVSPIGNFGDYRWTIDEQEDFLVVQSIYKHFVEVSKNEFFSFEQILAYIQSHPTIKKINEKYQRNEGLKKSILEDTIITELNKDGQN